MKSEVIQMNDLQDRVGFGVNVSGTHEKIDTPLTQRRSGPVRYELIDKDGKHVCESSSLLTLERLVLLLNDKDVTQDNPRMQKADRVLKKDFGLRTKVRPMPGSKLSGLRKRIDGTVVRR
jgi:hypothetical protein